MSSVSPACPMSEAHARQPVERQIRGWLRDLDAQEPVVLALADREEHGGRRWHGRIPTRSGRACACVCIREKSGLIANALHASFDIGIRAERCCTPARGQHHFLEHWRRVFPKGSKTRLLRHEPSARKRRYDRRLRVANRGGRRKTYFGELHVG